MYSMHNCQVYCMYTLSLSLGLNPKAVEKLVSAAETGCTAPKEQQIVLNSVRLLTRVLPYIFEDADWRGFFWSTLPGQTVRLNSSLKVFF